MHRSVRLVVLACLACLGSLLLGPATASAAQSPAFVSSRTSVDPDSGALVVPYEEAGLPGTATAETVTLSGARADATYQCFSWTGAPGARQPVSGPAARQVTFPVHAGVSRGWAWLASTPPGSFTCPWGQTRQLSFATFAGITLTGSHGNATAVKPEPISGGLGLRPLANA